MGEVRASVFVADLEVPVLDAYDRHHLERSLRLRSGDEIMVGDGAGRRRRARLGPTLEPTGDIEEVPAPRPPVAVAFAPGKRDRPEWAVQKLTELGADRIVLFTAERSVVRWEGERARSHVQRLRRIAREAAMQCRRAWLPELEEVTTFAEVAARSGTILASPDGAPPSLDAGLVLVGPEGGWSERELAADLPRVGLGAHVLRTETAAVAAGALLAGLRAGLVGPAR